MTQLTKRERVMRTVRFEETDRVPLYDLLQNDAVIEHFARRPLEVEGGTHTVGVAAGAMLDMTRSVGGPRRPDVYRTDDGMVIQQERWTSWIVERPFHDLGTLVEWVGERIREAKERVFDGAYVSDLRRAVEAHWAAFAEGDPTGRGDPTVLVLESGAGLTETYSAAGMGLFAELMMERPDVLEEWLEANNRAQLRRVAAIADPEYFPVVLTYDDIAHKTGTLFSPDWLRHYWIPGLKRLNDAWHERGAYCLFHSDGNLWSVLDDLVAAGIDGLNPIETLASMTVSEVRRAYPALFLAGGIDVSQLLTYGPPEAVRAACREAIAGTEGRGYFMGSTTELHWEAGLDNVLAMVETAMESAGDEVEQGCP